MMLSHQLATGPAASIEGLVQVGELGLGLPLSAVIGLEREVGQKSAGLRTHSLVGVGAALFMLVSKYGFSDVLRTGQVMADPSRVAAQIVTGIGFLGAGLIFVRRDSAASGFAVDELAADSSGADSRGADDGCDPGAVNGQRVVEVVLHVHGMGSVNDLATRLSELPGVRAVTAADVNAPAG